MNFINFIFYCLHLCVFVVFKGKMEEAKPEAVSLSLLIKTDYYRTALNSTEENSKSHPDRGSVRMVKVAIIIAE